MHSKRVTIDFELVHLINRTCNFRTEAFTEPYETSKMELFMKIVNGFKQLIIFTKKLHFDKVLNTHLQSKYLKNTYEEVHF